jgi:hypothetical protein
VIHIDHHGFVLDLVNAPAIACPCGLLVISMAPTFCASGGIFSLGISWNAFVEPPFDALRRTRHVPGTTIGQGDIIKEDDG